MRESWLMKLNVGAYKTTPWKLCIGEVVSITSFLLTFFFRHHLWTLWVGDDLITTSVHACRYSLRFKLYVVWFFDFKFDHSSYSKIYTKYHFFFFLLWAFLLIQDLQEWFQFGNVCTIFLKKTSGQIWSKKTTIWNGCSRCYYSMYVLRFFPWIYIYYARISCGPRATCT